MRIGQLLQVVVSLNGLMELDVLLDMLANSTFWAVMGGVWLGGVTLEEANSNSMVNGIKALKH